MRDNVKIILESSVIDDYVIRHQEGMIHPRWYINIEDEKLIIEFDSNIDLYNYHEVNIKNVIKYVSSIVIDEVVFTVKSSPVLNLSAAKRREYTQLYGEQKKLSDINRVRFRLEFPVVIKYNDFRHNVRKNEFPTMRYYVENRGLLIEVSTDTKSAYDYFTSNHIPLFEDVKIKGTLDKKYMFTTTNTQLSNMATVTWYIAYADIELDYDDITAYIYSNHKGRESDTFEIISKRFAHRCDTIYQETILGVKERYWQRCVNYINKKEFYKQGYNFIALHQTHMNRNKKYDFSFEYDNNRESGFYNCIVICTEDIRSRDSIEVLGAIVLNKFKYVNKKHSQLIKINDAGSSMLKYNKLLRGYYEKL